MESTNQNALPVGAILRGNDTYIIEKVLGSGGFGITYLASTTIRHGNLSLKVQVAIKEHFSFRYQLLERMRSRRLGAVVFNHRFRRRA